MPPTNHRINRIIITKCDPARVITCNLSIAAAHTLLQAGPARYRSSECHQLPTELRRVDIDTEKSIVTSQRRSERRKLTGGPASAPTTPTHSTLSMSTARSSLQPTPRRHANNTIVMIRLKPFLTVALTTSLKCKSDSRLQHLKQQ